VDEVSNEVRAQPVALVKPEALLVSVLSVLSLDAVNRTGKPRTSDTTHTHTHTRARAHTHTRTRYLTLHRKARK